MSYEIIQNFIPNLPHDTYDSGHYVGVVGHSTAVYGDTPLGERNYELTHWRDAFVHFFVDHEQIVQVADTNYVSWGAGRTANHQGFVQIELCQTYDENEFQESYKRYTWLMAKILKDANIQVIDGVTLMSHAQVSSKWGQTNHEDPLDYLKSHNVSWSQLVQDVKNWSSAIPTPPSRGGTTVTPMTTSSGFSYPNNAKIINDDLFIRDVNGTQIPNRYVSNGDNITIVEILYDKQLILVEYPTDSGIVKSGYVKNVPSCISYYYNNQYKNGSTPELTYNDSNITFGSLDPYETATPLYRNKSGFLKIMYNTPKGQKAGYVHWNGGFTYF